MRLSYYSSLSQLKQSYISHFRHKIGEMRTESGIDLSAMFVNNLSLFTFRLDYNIVRDACLENQSYSRSFIRRCMDRARCGLASLIDT